MTPAASPLAGVLVAAGRGRRMGGDKLWLDPFGRAIWRWSLDALLAVRGMTLVAVVVPAAEIKRFRVALPVRATDRCIFVAGGEARADSVRAGLTALTDAGVSDATVVLVHDAARPAAMVALMEAVADAVDPGSAAIPVVAVHDTLKQVQDGAVVETVDRTDVAAAQTPQAASLGILRAALDAAQSQGFQPTDEAAALAAIGVPVRAVPGDPANRKLTDPEDAEVLRAVLRTRLIPIEEMVNGPWWAAPADGSIQVRVGFGVDAHRLEEGRSLHLGGIEIPAESRGLVGHSDGDVALHALTDAVLGAAGQGDIGSLFPSSDDTWSGADSGVLLRRAVEVVREAGWAPVGADIVIGAESPSIAPLREEMASRVASLLGVADRAVTIRGTSTDSLGFPGGEGIAAWAVATVDRVE